jgi:hypothetical protein
MVQLMALFKEHVADSRAWRDRRETTPRTRRDRKPTQVTLLWSALLTLLALLGSTVTSTVTRQWLTVALANACILGGILVAPLVSVIAWIGLALPSQALLHQLAPILVTGSLIWFGLAIAGAHAFHRDQRAIGDDVK